MKTTSRLNWKMQLAFASAIVTLLLVGAVSYRGIVVSSESDQWVRHTDDVLANLQDLRTAMANSESSCRGFALTGKESYLESYRTGLLRLEQDQATIRNLTVDNPDQQRRLPLLASLAARQIGQMDQAINLRRAEDSAAAADVIQSQPIGDEFQEAVRNLQGEELRLRLLRIQDARRRLGQTKTVLVFGTAFGVLIAAAAGWSVQRDSSSRGRAEEALRLSEEKYRVLLGRDLSESKESGAKYRGLLEAAPDAMVVVNSDGEILLLNVQAEKQFGYSRDELVGQKVKNIDPPIARTVPSGRITAFISVRACDMLGPYTHFGLEAPRSMISEVAVAGLSPPMLKTFGS